MKPADEKRIGAKLAKIITLMCIRNIRRLMPPPIKCDKTSLYE